MKNGVLDEYHRSRDFTGKTLRSACYAPQVSLFFDTLGSVQACCQNVKYPLGNVAVDRLADIWNGPRIQSLRKALAKDNFAAGCQFCEWQISVGNYLGAYTRNFERFPVAELDPAWPQMMEFSVSNTCNLECVMCKGEFSSLIRSNREKLPPLPKAYGDQFFEDLRPFLPHLKYCKFLGGEPFLARESYRVWDLIIEAGLRLPCHVTTNGTQYNERVEQVLSHMPIELSVSLDGLTKPTLESIRRNANFETVMENFRRFHQYARRQGTYIGLTYCLMRQNWHEFGDFLKFADDWDCEVVVNLVREPPQCSLYTLPIRQLDEIAAAMEEQGRSLRNRLKRNRPVWDEHVGGLRRRVQRREDSTRPPFETPLALVVLDAKSRMAVREEERIDLARAQTMLRQWSPTAEMRRLETDRNDRVTALGEEERDWFGIEASACRGQLFEDLFERLRDRYGAEQTTVLEQSGHYVDRVHDFVARDGQVFALRTISLPRLSVFGLPEGALTLAAGTTIRATDSQAEHTSQPGQAGTAHADSLELARAQVTDWSGGRPPLTLQTDREGVFRSVVSGNLSELGIDPAEWIGRPLEEWFYPLRGRFGQERQVERWGQTADRFDRMVRFRTPQGPAHGRFCAVRRFDSQRLPAGWTVLVAAVALTAADEAALAGSARQSLREWEPTAFEGEITVDFNGRILDGQGAIPGFSVLASNQFCGHPLAEVLNEVRGQWGPATELQACKTGERTDRIWRLANDEGLRLVRAIRIAHFDAAGAPLGWRYLLAWCEVTAANQSTAQQQASETLAAWSGTQKILHVEATLQGTIVAVSGDIEAWEPSDSADLVGKSLDEFNTRLAARFGPPELYDQSATVLRTDRIQSCEGPLGPAFLRQISRLSWSAAVGEVRQVSDWGAVVVGRDPRRTPPEELIDRFRAVELGRPCLELALDREGIVRYAEYAGPGTAPPETAQLVGQDQQALDDWLAAQLGPPRTLARNWTLYFDERIEQCEPAAGSNRPPQRTHHLRWPVFDEQGLWHGWQAVVAVAQLDPSTLEKNRGRQCERLTEWEPTAGLLSLLCATDGTIVSAEGPSPWLAELPGSPLEGKTLDDWDRACTAEWGPATLYDLVRATLTDDRTDHFHGPHGRTQRRTITVPTFGPGGEPAELRLVAVRLPAALLRAGEDRRAQAALQEGLPEAEFWRLDFDAAGRVVDEQPPAVDPLNVRGQTPLGRHWEEMLSDWQTRWGRPRSVEVDEPGERLHRERRQFGTPRGLLQLHTVRMPLLDDEGRSIGCRRWVGLRAVTAETRRVTPDEAGNLIREWSRGEAQWLLRTDRAQQVIEARLVSGTADGADPRELLGTNLSGLPAWLAERWGASQVAGFQESPELIDATLVFRQPGARRTFRGLHLPEFDAEGNWTGFCVQAGWFTQADTPAD